MKRTNMSLTCVFWVVLVFFTASHTGASAQSDYTTVQPEFIDSTSLAGWCNVLFALEFTSGAWDLVQIRLDSDWDLTPLVRIDGDRWDMKGRYALTPFLSQTTVTNDGRRLRAITWDEVDLEAYVDGRGVNGRDYVNGSYVALLELTIEDTIVLSIQRVDSLLPKDESQTYRKLWSDRTSNIGFEYIGKPPSLILRIATLSYSMGAHVTSDFVFTRYFQIAPDYRLRFLQSLATQGGLWDQHGPELDWNYHCEVLDCDQDSANELLYSRTALISSGVSSTFREPGVAVFEYDGESLICDRFLDENGTTSSLQGELPEWILPFPQKYFEGSLNSADSISITAIEEDLKYKFSFSTFQCPSTANSSASTNRPQSRILCRASDDSLYVFVADAGVYPYLICFAPATSRGTRLSETRLLSVELSGPDSSLVYAWSGNDHNRVSRWVNSSLSRFRVGKYDGPDFVIPISLSDAYLSESDLGNEMCRFALFVFVDGVPADGSESPLNVYPLGAKFEDPNSWGTLLIVDRSDSDSRTR